MIANKKPTQTERLLRFLKARGKHGLTNFELNDHIGYRYSARIYELKQKGYNIRRRHDGGTQWTFWLEPEYQVEDVA